MKILNILILICLAPYANSILAQPLACDPTADPGQICVGNSSQLNANATGGSGSYTYSWTSNPPGFASDLASPLVSPIQSTAYNVTVNDGNNTVEGSVTVTVNPSPQPDLGPDTLICEGTHVTLNANCIADFFSWSTGQFGVSSITVSDSGTYWVRAKFSESGCEGFDTIHVGFHPHVLIDEPGVSSGEYLIYPNPVNNILHICSLTNHASQIEIFFYDMQGRMILSDKFISTVSLNLQGVDPGIYMLIIRGENRVENHKVIVY